MRFRRYGFLLVLVTILLSAATFVLRSSPPSSQASDRQEVPIVDEKLLRAPLATEPLPTLERKPVWPWAPYAPLDEDERAAFRLVLEQIEKYQEWGAMDAALIPQFRQLLFQFGSRALADLGRRLAAIDAAAIETHADAAAIIDDLDTLAYFTRASFPLAHEIVRSFATRPIAWDQSGQLLDPLAALVTLEAFDLYARDNPTAARGYIKSIAPAHRAAYFTHFAYGRRLAGRTMQDIDRELRFAFKSPAAAFALQEETL